MFTPSAAKNRELGGRRQDMSSQERRAEGVARTTVPRCLCCSLSQGWRTLVNRLLHGTLGRWPPRAARLAAVPCVGESRGGGWGPLTPVGAALLRDGLGSFGQRSF